jgi:hypothetical protein
LRVLWRRQAEVVQAARALVDYEQDTWGTPKYDRAYSITLLHLLIHAVNSERAQNYHDPAR